MSAQLQDSLPAEPTFRLHEVALQREGRSLVGPVSTEFAPGRLYGLLGHNGSGKSTLLKLMARQLNPSAGTLAFEGQPVADWSPRAFARRVAYLAQQLPEATGLTVRELVALGRFPWHGTVGRFGAEDHAQVAEALRLTDMESMADRLVDTLSGGERQRAWLAMLVAQNGRCMLLDEPISALDVAHQMEVMSLVLALCHQRQLTIIVVLHDINIAARFCDQLLALHAGREVASGTPEEVVQPEVLQRIYGVEMGVLRHPRQPFPISYVG